MFVASLKCNFPRKNWLPKSSSSGYHKLQKFWNIFHQRFKKLACCTYKCLNVIHIHNNKCDNNKCDKFWLYQNFRPNMTPILMDICLMIWRGHQARVQNQLRFDFLLCLHQIWPQNFTNFPPWINLKFWTKPQIRHA